MTALVLITSNTFTIKVLPVGELATSFQLTSSVGGTNLPFSIGHAFKKGDVPSNAQLIGNIGSLQITGKNWWPDGSLKFALISGRADLTAGVARTIKLSLGTPAAGVALTTADLRATGITASTIASTFGSAGWAGADWDAPFMNWVTGPQMSSWIYRKPIGNDAHLVAWLEVRLFAGGAVEILPWVENGYLRVASPSSKLADYAFSLGGVERFRANFDLPSHCRTVLLSGTRFSYWHGVDPQIVPSHDKAYLQATRLVPAYSATVGSGASVWTYLAKSYSPLQQGNYSNDMGQTGYAPAIGLLPEWDVLYLVSQDARAYAGVVANAYSAGRYGIHFRDETTDRPLRFSSYPNLVHDGFAMSGSGASTINSYTPTQTGTVPPTWDTPHHPSVGFMAYLLTGRFYFMEEVQFSATVGFLKNNDNYRQFAGGVFLTNSGANTTRGAAWSVRTLAQAACATPDGDTALRNEFVASMEANIVYYHSHYVAQPNNTMGIVAPYSNYTGGLGYYSTATWQEDFFTAAFGYAIDLALPLSATNATKLRSFFEWKAQSIVGRLGGTGATEYLFTHAAPYTIAVAPADSADFVGGTGPFYSNWGQIYTQTNGAPNPGVAGPLTGGNFPDPAGYWANLQPAIAYAVQHNVDGAVAAYARMRGAPNWSLLSNGWNEAPVWAVIPRNN